MLVRLTKHWNGWKPGRVFNQMPDGQANVLIRRGLAVEHTEEPPTPREEPDGTAGSTKRPRAAKSRRRSR